MDQRVIRIGSYRLLRFPECLVKSPDVTINQREFISRFGQTRVQTQCAAIFSNCLFMRETVFRRPQKTTSRNIRDGEVWIQLEGFFSGNESLLRPLLLVRRK